MAGVGFGAGRGSLAGAVRVPPLLADDPAGGVDGFVGVCSRLLAGVAATAGLDRGVDWLLLCWLFSEPFAVRFAREGRLFCFISIGIFWRLGFV